MFWQGFIRAWNSPPPEIFEIEYVYYCAVPDCNLRGSKFKFFLIMCILDFLFSMHTTLGVNTAYIFNMHTTSFIFSM